MHVYKVWCSLRDKKKGVAAEGVADLLEKVKAKFSYENISLVLEEDGTEIDDDDDDVLRTYKDKTLMVLNEGEVWKDRICSTPSSRSSTPSPQTPGNPATPRSSPASRPMWHSGPSSAPKKKGEWAEKFEVPWAKLRPDILTKLEMSVDREMDPKVKPGKNELSEIIRMVVAELRLVDKYPGRAVFENVAVKMISKFKVLGDLDEDGKFIGSGIGTVVFKLDDHNNYQNRPDKNASLIALATSPATPLGKRKRNSKKSQAKSGTKNWQPEYVEGEDDSSQKEKKKWLQTESKKSARDRDHQQVENYMELTYSTQRLYFNTVDPTVEQVKSEWPLLLEVEYLFKHSEKLILEFDRDIEYLSSLKMKKVLAVVEEIIIVEKAKAIMEKDIDIKREKMMQADDAMSILSSAKTSNPVVGTVLLVAHKFQELKKGKNYLFVHKEEGSTRDEVLAAPKNSSPCIVVVGRSIYEATCYYVVAENNIIVSTPLASQAVTVLYCLFYVFNMAFPLSLGHTWEFLQRYFFKNNPGEGSKNPKKKLQFGNTTARVLSFMRDIVRHNFREDDLEEESDAAD